VAGNQREQAIDRREEQLPGQIRTRTEELLKTMLIAIVRSSLRFRGVVLSLAIALLGYGIYSLTQAKYDVFPEFASELPVRAEQSVRPSSFGVPLFGQVTGLQERLSATTTRTDSHCSLIPAAAI
jgi:hypothetical protein